MRLYVLAALAAGALAQGGCDTSAKCEWNIPYNGGTFNFNARRLCNKNADYVLSDEYGHIYYAQICGQASKNCLPKDWNNEYEYGRVIQTWGDAPPCDYSCMDKVSGAATCCTEQCQVVAVLDPVIRSIVPGDISQGIELFYQGETPRLNDPFNNCDYNPETGKPYQRTTHLQFFCDATVDGFAKLYEVKQNGTDDCDYLLKFKTSAACVSMPLSRGWDFVITVLSLSAIYVAGALGWNWYRTREIGFPPSHTAFWKSLDALALDGLLYLLSGFKRRGTGGGGISGAAYSSVKEPETASSGAAPAFSGSSERSAYTDL